MKRNFLALTCFLGFALSSSISQAVYIEPYLGMIVSGTMKTVGSTTESDLKGNGMGLKLGWNFAGLAVGVDYSMGSMEEDASGVTTDSKFTNLGAFADFDFPVVPIHIYGAYILKSTIDPDNSTTNVLGKGMKLGAGFTGLPFVAINLDYSTLKYDETDPASAGSFEINANVVMLSVSLPLNL